MFTDCPSQIPYKQNVKSLRSHASLVPGSEIDPNRVAVRICQRRRLQSAEGRTAPPRPDVSAIRLNKLSGPASDLPDEVLNAQVMGGLVDL